MLTALLYLLFITIGSGLAVWKILGIEEEDDAARFFLYIATGLVVFVQATTVLGFLHLSNWVTYLILTVALLAIAFRKGDFSLRMPKISKAWIIVLIIFAIHLYIYFLGATSYLWLEDDDPWGHASAARYVSIYSTYLQPADLPIHYLAPYPPFFDVLLGTLFQVSGPSLQLILKFFNALLISLAIPFFFCFAKRFIGDRKALWATFILAVLPCFMSHFIWAQSLTVMLVFPALYLLERFRLSEIKNEKIGFGVLAVLAGASVMITSPSSAAMFFGMIGIYVASLTISGFAATKKLDFNSFKWPLIVVAVAFILALIEFWIPMFLMFPTDKVLYSLSLTTSIITDRYGDTGGGLIYSISDFTNAPFASKMDQPVGIGIIVCLLTLAGLFGTMMELKDDTKRVVSLILILWLAYCFIGVEGNALPVKLVPHRFWVFLAIPVALVAGCGTVYLLEFIKGKASSLVWIAALAIFIGIFISSASPKIAVETSQWPPGVLWVSQEQITGYIGLLGLPNETKIFNFCLSEDAANGFDKFGYAWEKEVSDYKNISITSSDDDNHAFLKKYGYAYAIIDQSCLKTFSTEQVNAKASALMADSRFQQNKQLSNKAFLVYEVK
jgi:asparagine N-glycosylation enzyme membrane subunit Stt3